MSEKLERARQNGLSFVIAPPALIELTRGMVEAGALHFENDKRVFTWIRDSRFEILPLPYPFMARILRAAGPRRGRVEPCHYEELIGLVSGAANFEDFTRRTAGTVWDGVGRANQVHNDELDKEIAALSVIAKKGRGQDLAKRLASKFGAQGNRPNPLLIARRFSAALGLSTASLPSRPRACLLDKRKLRA